MIALIPWTQRTWSFGLPIGAFPAVLERLRGTPARAADLVTDIDDARLRTSAEGSWSAKQHIGHLDDLHELDERRLEEFLAGAPILSAADMTNRRTHQGNHNDVPIEAILRPLRAHRLELVRRMEQLSEAEIGATATHPRLRQPVRLLDWAVFVAEHDDHHLASARAALHRVRGSA